MKNHLKNQTSPYLLQHAENPVDWYPWGEEAFRRAEEEDKPVFLSIGYSTCIGFRSCCPPALWSALWTGPRSTTSC